MIIRYKTNKDNKDYIVIDGKDTAFTLFLSIEDGSIENKVSSQFSENLNEMYGNLFNYEKEKNIGYISEISIPKASELGIFLLENTDMQDIIDEDKEVSYEKVVNAFNIAMFEENPIAPHIRPLFQGQVSGTVEQLSLMYPKELLTYILENPSFEAYLRKFNGEYEEPTVYTVYENGEFSQKQFSKPQNEPKFVKQIECPNSK